MDEPVGKVTHYFGHLGVAAAQLTGQLKVGDQVRIKGHTTDFTQPVDSLEVEHQKVDQAGPGDSVAFKVKDKARIGDQVLRVPPPQPSP
jgi:putative protease